jgi:rubrerythrin
MRNTNDESDLPGLHQAIKGRTRFNAARQHQGPGHWHVRIRSSVIECRGCGTRLPKWSNPPACPECGSGNNRADNHNN